MSNSVVINYKLLRKLKPEFIKSIKTVSVFGRYGTDVLIVTKDDKVFAFGENRNGCLGLGTNKPVAEPTLVNELCDKKVVRFAFGYRHVLVLTKTGQLFSYGYNEFGQLANRTTIDCYVPKLILINELMRHFIDDISCGAFHSLALTRTGLVYAWGFNFWGQLGNGNNCNQLIPLQVRAINREVVVAIDCGHHQSVVLTKSGHVYAWGHNAFGQLGIGCTDRFRNIPTKVLVTSDDILVTKIVCGQNHCLLLTIDGHIYAFGCNYFGQIGNDTKTDQFAPTRIGNTSVKFVDIEGSLFSNSSVARASNKRTYIWGKCVDERLWVPRETPIKSLVELFARRGSGMRSDRYAFPGEYEPMSRTRGKSDNSGYSNEQIMMDTLNPNLSPQDIQDRIILKTEKRSWWDSWVGGDYNKIYGDLVDPKLSIQEVTSRLPTVHSRATKVNVRSGYCSTPTCNQCLDSCKFLKYSKYSSLDITQYTYLRLCSEGCKDNL
ncbi:unnamed protein product [Oppiella nova]|uniref:RCC1-like domain-containing protein n=1 Tax=Oppiella nova TaxID=334625 RepID=A0A7R9QML5_9ACAR|nr:unnamed protein product [Oppiella nova]CAG2168303.1 unnamed protein product [Oppiella nova]